MVIHLGNIFFSFSPATTKYRSFFRRLLNTEVGFSGPFNMTAICLINSQQMLYPVLLYNPVFLFLNLGCWKLRRSRSATLPLAYTWKRCASFPLPPAAIWDSRRRCWIASHQLSFQWPGVQIHLWHRFIRAISESSRGLGPEAILEGQK
jgi:hypothetical protein